MRRHARSNGVDPRGRWWWGGQRGVSLGYGVCVVMVVVEGGGGCRSCSFGLHFPGGLVAQVARGGAQSLHRVTRLHPRAPRATRPYEARVAWMGRRR